MAVLDPENDTIVIRVVYDGPPMAGKTTSVKKLASGLGGSVVVPEEVAGRTLFFDWLDYTGGLFEGRRIRCQIVSVPGQATLASRRRHLLQSADVVVFVGDSTRDAQPSVRSYLEGLRAVLAGVAGPPVGIVLQANKRDDPHAVPIEDMRQTLSAAEFKIAIIESVATEGSGIREAFVFAVRLALDRVRELMRLGQISTTRPEVNSAADLLSELKKVEGSALELAADTGLIHRRLSELHATPATALPVAADAFQEVLEAERTTTAPAISRRAPVVQIEQTAPEPPGSDLPSGMIWPPVDGRLFLHEATSARPTIALDINGDWYGAAGNAWTLQSPSIARFEKLDEARQALLAWARQHVAGANIISAERCVVLAQDAQRFYRLWQIVKVQRSMRDHFESEIVKPPDALAAALVLSADRMLDAAQRWHQAGCKLPLSLRSVSAGNTNPYYLGQMPYPASTVQIEPRQDAAVLDMLAMGLAFAKPALVSGRTELIGAIDRIAVTARGEREVLRTNFLRQFLQRL